MKLSHALPLLSLGGLPVAFAYYVAPPPANSGDFCCFPPDFTRKTRFLEAMEKSSMATPATKDDTRHLQIEGCDPCKQSCDGWRCEPMPDQCICLDDTTEPWCDDFHVCENDPQNCCSDFEILTNSFYGCPEEFREVFCTEDEIPEPPTPIPPSDRDCDKDYCCIHGYLGEEIRERQRFLRHMDPTNKNNHHRKLLEEKPIYDDDCNPCEEDCSHSYCFPMEEICSCDDLNIEGGEEYDVKMVDQMGTDLTTVEMMDGDQYVTYICPENLDVCPHDPASCCVDGYTATSKTKVLASCGDIPYTTFCPAGGANGSCGGDPHFKTWSGDWFDFHGICDLILVRAKAFAKGLGLDIHIRTKERYGYSFIETAVIRIGDSILEVSGYGQYLLNGISNAAMPNTMADGLYSVTYVEKSEKEHVFSIQIGKKEKIEVSTFKDMVSVKVDFGSKKNFGDSEGLMGSFPRGKMVDRNGNPMPSDDFNAFGQEWQVLDSEPMLFQTVRAPQHPQTCYIPEPPKMEGRRRLGESIGMEAAKMACGHWDDDKKDMRIFDVMAMGDLEVAQTHGAY